MIQNIEQMQEAMVLPNAKIIPSQIIDSLSTICQNRNHALSAYPHDKGADSKFSAIAEIKYYLKQAKECRNPKDSVRICLSLELLFHRIAPSATSSLCKNFFKRFNPIMDDCRTYLNRRAQV